jgi:hypothetical protein
LKRLAAAVLLVVSACTNGDRPGRTDEVPPATRSPAASTRELAVTELSAEPNGTGTCGEFDVEWRSPELGGDGEPALFEVQREDERVFALGGTNPTDQLIGLWCGDITGDGAVELAIEEYTGGAHCCFGIRVITLDGRVTLLNKDLGNSGGPDPKQLDDTQPLEIVTTSDVLAYFGDLPFAASPLLPLVFALHKGTFRDATTDFSEYIETSLTQAEKDMDEAVANSADFPEAIRGMALGVYGHHVLLGDEDEALEAIVAKLSADEGQWLIDHAADARELIRD